ncbi:MAG: futalosine hydrolase [Bacteroidota bacterium]
MKILIVSATHFEVIPLTNFLGIALPTIGKNHANMDFEEKDIDVLITGVGMVNTALMIGRVLDDSYDLVLNVGICGAFDKTMELGQVVRIKKDILSELGAEDDNDFLTYDQLDLSGAHIYFDHVSDSYKIALRSVTGITVNTVHGNEQNIEKVRQLYHPDVESMEGAAFFAACLNSKSNYMQIRAISNHVEKRDKSKWQMALAIKNLNDYLINLITTIH